MTSGLQVATAQKRKYIAARETERVKLAKDVVASKQGR